MSISAPTPIPVSTQVGNSAVTLKGASGDTTDDTYKTYDRYLRVTNCSASLDLYIAASSLSGGVSTTSFQEKISPGASITIMVRTGENLQGIRASSSTDLAVVREELR